MVRSIITVSEQDKRWLENYSRQNRVSAAEVIRRAIRLYRRQQAEPTSLQRVLEETAGTWRSLPGDSQQYVDSLRAEWEERR
jgi:Arc/MetJ-type ribon-helix-helix transcriptional regulator